MATGLQAQLTIHSTRSAPILLREIAPCDILKMQAIVKCIALTGAMAFRVSDLIEPYGAMLLS